MKLRDKIATSSPLVHAMVTDPAEMSSDARMAEIGWLLALVIHLRVSGQHFHEQRTLRISRAARSASNPRLRAQ